MPDHVYKVVEVVGHSTESIADAARNAVSKAAETLRNIEWFEVGNIRGHVVNGAVDHFRSRRRLASASNSGVVMLAWSAKPPACFASGQGG